MRSGAQRLAVSAAFTSLFVILRSIPTFPILGLPGGRFPASDVLLPLYGVVLGPLQGSLVVLLGTVVGFAIRAPVFLFLDFLPPLTNTLISGLLSRRRTWLALTIYTSALVAFIVGPFTLTFVRIELLGWGVEVPFHWLHLAALPLVMLFTKMDTHKGGTEGVTWLGFSGYALLGTMGQHSVGSLLFQCVFGLTGAISREGFVALWHAVFWVYPIERELLVLVSTLIGVPVARALARALRGLS